MKGLEIDLAGTLVRLKHRYMIIGDALVLADLHLGKTMHFRKAGMAIPMAARDADQSELLRILNEEKPDRVIVLGDLFHSASNSECEELMLITSQFPQTDFLLVMGNHDILEPQHYRSMDFDTCERLEIDQLVLTHEPLEGLENGQMNLHGHIHPGVRLSGKARQSFMVPCFHRTEKHFCLPAFGALTGLMRRKPEPGDAVYAVFEEEVAQVF